MLTCTQGRLDIVFLHVNGQGDDHGVDIWAVEEVGVCLAVSLIFRIDVDIPSLWPKLSSGCEAAGPHCGERELGCFQDGGLGRLVELEGYP